MCPVSLNTSRSISALEKGQAKLWILLVGINQYQDKKLSSLRYAAIDCQKLGEALSAATKLFPQKDVMIHHDFALETPELAVVRKSLRHIVSSAKDQDTVIFYFSGHGLLDPDSKETFLCLADTYKDNLANTGLKLQELLNLLSNCTAHKQLVWLDSCHSGNMTLSGAKGNTTEKLVNDPTPQMMDLLRQRSAKSKGFYALLSCDQGQSSWEFADLGHGVFTYYLMRGLRGEAANSQGIIDADHLYSYIYERTLDYIDKANQQLRLMNQQKRIRGEINLYPEYSLQTPKRIVEGVGELILGFEPDNPVIWQKRYALILDGLDDGKTCQSLSDLLQKEGDFLVQYLKVEKQELQLREAFQSFCRQENKNVKDFPVWQESVTLFLYLRGKIEKTKEGECYLDCGHGIQIKSSWLKQELRSFHQAQQIVILDCSNADYLLDWVEEFKLHSAHGQCLVAASTPAEESELFAQVVLESLISANPQLGISVAEWLIKLQTNLESLGINFHVWLSALQGVIEVLPRKFTNKKQQTLFNNPITLVEPKLDEKESVVKFLTKSDFSSEEYSSLEKILREIIGPIGANLLEEELTKTTNFQDLVKNLSLHLSIKQQVNFKKWIENRKVSEKIYNHQVIKPNIPKAEVSPSLSSAQLTSSKLSTEYYDQIKFFLTDLVGPIASILLGQIDQSLDNPDAILAALQDYLNPNQQTIFKSKVTSLFSDQKTKLSPKPSVELQLDTGITLGARGPNNSVTESNQIIEEKYIYQCEEALTKFIGPIAKFIVAKTLKDNPQLSFKELLEALAMEIPNSSKADEFRRYLS